MITDVARMRMIDIRRKNKLKQIDVARALGYLSSKAYFELESGKTALKVEHLDKLSSFYDVPVSYFFEDFNSKTE